MTRGIAAVGLLLVGFLAGWIAPTSGDFAFLGSSAEVVREALVAPDRLVRFRDLTRALDRAGPDDLSSIRPVFKEKIAGLGECEVRAFMDAWARFDGPGALDIALTDWRSFPAKRELGVEAALTAWAYEDHEMAQAGALELLESSPRLSEIANRGILTGWVYSGGEGLEEHLESLSTDRSRDTALSLILGAKIRVQGVEELLAWVSAQLPNVNSSLQNKMLRKTARAGGYRRPDLVGPWILDWYAREDYAAEGPRILAEAWVKVDPEGGFQWVRDEVPEEIRTNATELAFGLWLARDPTIARAWLKEQDETDPFWDPAIKTAARNMARRAPEDAAEFCTRSVEREALAECQTSVANQWFREDPEAAEAWIQTSVIDEESRQEIRDRAQKSARRKARRASRGRRSAGAEAIANGEPAQ